MTGRSLMGLVGICGILAMGCAGGDEASNCSAACEVIVPCLMDTTENCLAQCQGDLSDATNFSPACGAAVNDLAACIGGLSCTELDAWLTEIPADSYPCRDNDIAIDEC